VKRWQHQHSIGAGVVIGLLISTHIWTIIVACFLAGLFLGRFWNWLVMVEEAVRMKLTHNKRPTQTRKIPY